MICRHCGKRIPEDAAYCPSCGKRIESHLRAEDRVEYRYESEREDEYEEPKGKRRLRALISILAAIIFVVAAFIIVMGVIKKYTGDDIWSRDDRQSTEAEAEENAGFPKSMYITAEDGLLLREDPGTEGKAIHLLNYGLEIQVEKIKDDWAYTTVDGLSGWCPAEYLTENKEDISQKAITPESDEDKSKLAEPSVLIKNGYHGTVNAEGGLNLRCGPGEEYDILLVVPEGTEVIEEGWSSGWLYVRYDGQYGWVKSEYVTPTGVVEGA